MLSAREIHNANTPDELRQKQAEFLHRNRLAGGPQEYVHASAALGTAYVNDGIWIADCVESDCNNGCAVDVDDRKARCFACGATFSVLMPPDASEIEAVLQVRPKRNRNWYPHESLELLQAENEANL